MKVFTYEDVLASGYLDEATIAERELLVAETERALEETRREFRTACAAYDLRRRLASLGDSMRVTTETLWRDMWAARADEPCTATELRENIEAASRETPGDQASCGNTDSEPLSFNTLNACFASIQRHGGPSRPGQNIVFVPSEGPEHEGRAICVSNEQLERATRSAPDRYQRLSRAYADTRCRVETACDPLPPPGPFIEEYAGADLLPRAPSPAPMHSDWLFPDLAYNALCNAVEKLDPQAAEYMRTEARGLPGFKETDMMFYAFLWRHSRQGHDYWKGIRDQLPEEYK